MFTPMRFLGCVALLGSALYLLGCGSDDPVTYTYPDTASYCDGRAHAECSEKIVGRCNTTVDSCVVKRKAVCTASIPGTYRPAQADGCVEAVRAAYADDELKATEQKSIDTACALLFGGTGTVGSSCSKVSECNLDQGLTCVLRAGGQGTCQTPVKKNSGDACDSASTVCPESDFCTASAPQVCAHKMALGKACGATLVCEDNLRCVVASGATDGTCQAKSPLGTICVDDNECADGMCVQIGTGMQCAGSTVFAPNEPICQQFK